MAAASGRKEKRVKRLFFALWPDDATRQQCRTVVKKIADKEFRPVAAGYLHVTLVFLGNINADQEAAISEAAGALTVPEMELTFASLDFWKKPQVLCLTSHRFSKEVSILVEQLTAIVTRYGIAVDERPFKPHVTLARKAKADPAVVEFEPIVWHADAFCLVESSSTAKGVEYRVIKRWSGVSC